MFRTIALAVLVLTSVAGAAGSELREGGCPSLERGAGYASRVESALSSGPDVWGNALLATPRGPTYADARRYLTPLFFARGPRGRHMTESGAHYLAFTHPLNSGRSASAALHVAEGSQIVSRRVGGPSLTVHVGREGAERYGSCRSRLSTPQLAEGYLPILQTGYADAVGVRYVQESFAARLRGEAALTSFVALTADAGVARGDAEIRVVPDEGRAVRYKLPSGRPLTTYLAWSSAEATRVETIDRLSYEAARSGVVRYWNGRLSEGSSLEVPEQRVQDAVRALLVQNLGLGWRYSVGNPYQQFSYPEALDVAQVMAAYGFQGVSAATLRRSLSTPRGPYPNWRLGQKLVATALHYRLFADSDVVAELTPELHRGVNEVRRQLASSPRGLLRRERYSSDIPDLVYGLHSQAVVWQGLLAMGQVWARTGYPLLAQTSLALARRLGVGLRSAVRRSRRPLSDGSLFVPVRLLDGERPYRSVTASRAGSYWNLVLPYALASGLFEPGGADTQRVLEYLLRHGSRLLGLVRAGAYSLYGRSAAHPTGGVNPVYGLNVSRFLADNDRPDRLVLSLYGQLAAGMTRGTFVSGEAVSVVPLRGEYLRSTYLPPNAASNASFLETLRLMLVHETRARDGTPTGLELAYATPRAWLEPGKKIAVRGLPTTFGAISFTIERIGDRLRVVLELPSRSRISSVLLRLRLPVGERIGQVTLDGRLLTPDRDRETFDLTGARGRLVVVGAVRRGSD